MEHGGAVGIEVERLGQLGRDDEDRSPGGESGQHRLRQQVGHAPQSDQAQHYTEETDEEGQRLLALLGMPYAN